MRFKNDRAVYGPSPGIIRSSARPTAMVHLSKAAKLQSAIAISSAFFIVEVVVGFRQRSLALVADAFHVASGLSKISL